MKPLTLLEIANACNGKLFGDEKLIVTSIETDSRNIREGSLFAAIPGNKVDGHKFIEPSISKGMVCALCERKPECDTPYILVDSTLQALKDIATYYRSLFNIPFIGITGSVGKTSTKEMISSVLSQKFKVHKTSGNFNNELGVPLTLFKLEEYHEIAVIEMGINSFGEMSRLGNIVKPNIEVFTNIGNCHLEKLIDRDGVYKAKTEMIDFLKKDGTIYYNGDDDKLKQISSLDKNSVSFGLSDSNDYFATNIESNETTSVNCRMICKNGAFNVTIPALGDFMVINALCAAAIGENFGLSLEEIKNGIEKFENVGSRSRIIETESLTIIDDCYNANPTSVKASIDALAKFNARTVAIIGDMKELGKSEFALHEETGKYICDRGIELLICVGPLSKYTSKGYLGSEYFDNIDSCINSVSKLLKKGDVVLVKASHSMHFEKIVEKLVSLNL